MLQVHTGNVSGNPQAFLGRMIRQHFCLHLSLLQIEDLLMKAVWGNDLLIQRANYTGMDGVAMSP
jgi:hypothetical protein